MSPAGPRSDSGLPGRRSRNGTDSRTRLLAALVLGAFIALGLAACSEKIVDVDPGFTAPEGTATPLASLTVWREIPNRLYIFRTGRPEDDPPIPHVLIDSAAVVTDPVGQLNGMIHDSTVASAYQVYKRQPNGGVLEHFDFATDPARRYVDRGWEIYHFTDPDTVVPTRSYQGRGIVAGAPSTKSPVTNPALDQVRAVANITYRGNLGASGTTCNPLDSLFLMEWQHVDGAVGYFIHVYQPAFNLVQLVEQIESGKPAPMFIGKSRDYLVAWYVPNPLPAPNAIVSFRMPTPTERRADTQIMTVRQTRFGQEYRVRIAAVDANHQLIAYTHGSFSQDLTNLPDRTLPSGQHASYFLGAVSVTPVRVCAP